MPRNPSQATSAEAIKALARQQMAQKGSAGLSLRGIARELGITAPAIYNYFRRMDDLITALIMDAFNALGDAVQAGSDSLPEEDPGKRLKAGILAYRQWAVDHPADFQLIYGNPIPGYEAPSELTVPLARRPLETLGLQMGRAWQRGRLTIPDEYQHVPPHIAQHMEGWLLPLYGELPMPLPLFYLLIAGWTRIHGMVMLELFDHTPPTIGDPAGFYEREVDILLRSYGLGDTP